MGVAAAIAALSILLIVGAAASLAARTLALFVLPPADVSAIRSRAAFLNSLGHRRADDVTVGSGAGVPSGRVGFRTLWLPDARLRSWGAYDSYSRTSSDNMRPTCEVKETAYREPHPGRPICGEDQMRKLHKLHDFRSPLAIDCQHIHLQDNRPRVEKGLPNTKQNACLYKRQTNLSNSLQ